MVLGVGGAVSPGGRDDIAVGGLRFVVLVTAASCEEVDAVVC